MMGMPLGSEHLMVYRIQSRDPFLYIIGLERAWSQLC